MWHNIRFSLAHPNYVWENVVFVSVLFVLYNAMNGLMYAIDWLFPYAGSMNYSQKFKYFISFYRIYIYIVKHWIESHKCWTQHNDYLIPNQPSPAIGWMKKKSTFQEMMFPKLTQITFYCNFLETTRKFSSTKNRLGIIRSTGHWSSAQ